MEKNPVFGLRLVLRKDDEPMDDIDDKQTDLVLQDSNPQQPPMADFVDRQADKNKPTSVHVNIQDKKSSGKSSIAVVAILAILVLAVAVAGIIVLVFFNPSTNNQSKEQIESLKLDIENMRQLLNQAGNFTCQRLDINDLQEIMVQTNTIQALQSQLNSSNEKIQGLQSQLNTSTKNIQGLRSQLNRSKEQTQDLWSQLNQTFQIELVNLKELQNKTEFRSNHEVQDLQLQLNTSNHKIQTLRLEVMNTRDILNTSNQEIQTLQLQIEHLNQLPVQINNSTREIDQLRETLNLTEINTSQDIQSLQVEVDGLLNKTESGVTCPNVLPPENGQLSFVSGANMMALGLGSVATYSCDTGYVLVGQTTRVCDDRNGGTVTTGTWSGTTPTCQVILCLELSAPDNGTVIINTGSNSPQIGVGTTATYSCDTDYVLVGQTTRVCEDRNGGTTGEWSGIPPRCEVIVICQPLTHPNNGAITVSTGTYGVTLGLGAVATYSCNTGFGLVGQTTRVCEDTNGGTTGTWGGSSPRCEEVVTCQLLTEPNNGAITFITGVNNVNIGLGSVATYSCDAGYVIVGQTTRVCQNINGGSIGDWSGSSPACSEVVTCQSLTQPGNGTVTISSGIDYLSVGSVATYSCITGYALIGQTTRVCEDRNGGTTGIWNRSPPTCEVILCLELSAPDNGTVIVNTDSNSLQIGVGTTATYSCDTGYVLVGQSNRVCEDRNGGAIGTWSGSLLTCGIPNNAIIDCQQTACRNEQLICPEHNNCTVNCDDSRSYACYQTAVACSAGGDCVVNCDDSYACLGATTTCPDGGNCITNCDGAHACTQAITICSTSANCITNCDDQYACLQATSECTGGNCVMNCDNDYSCRNLTVAGSPDGYSIVNCRDSYACQYANITCPEGGNCTVVCDDYNSCRYTTITCRENSNCTINCTAWPYTYSRFNRGIACYRANITCPRNSGDCDLNCDGYSSCSEANIACPGGKECVNCNGYYSCRYTTFTFPDSKVGNITCTGSSSCYRANFMCPVNDSCDIACIGSSSCQYANFRCTESESCTVPCTGSSSCIRANFMCPVNESCDIACSGSSSCQSANFRCTDSESCTINCSGEQSCSSATITCPLGGECAINCSGEQSCTSATITCPENHDCTINCNGTRGCANTRVTCPTGDYNCNINCTDPFSCEDLRITNTANVNLQCCGGVSCAGTNVIPTSRPECVFT